MVQVRWTGFEILGIQALPGTADCSTQFLHSSEDLPFLKRNLKRTAFVNMHYCSYFCEQQFLWIRTYKGSWQWVSMIHPICSPSAHPNHFYFLSYIRFWYKVNGLHSWEHPLSWKIQLSEPSFWLGLQKVDRKVSPPLMYSSNNILNFQCMNRIRCDRYSRPTLVLRI